MARSKHTRPLRIRAADRLRRPREPRGADDPRRLRRAKGRLKRAGFALSHRKTAAGEAWPLPRIIERRPRPGFGHPASASEIAASLRICGEEAVYGLRRIELRQGQREAAFGRLLLPGRIILYDQPPSPWRLPASMALEAEAMKKHGARLDADAGLIWVHWGREALRDYWLSEVLLHELGHHRLQHHKGQRRRRIARTRDHEAAASLHARRLGRRL